MYCSKCGKEVKEEKFCPNCGNATSNNNQTTDVNKKRSKKIIIISILVVVLILAIGGGLTYYFLNVNKTEVETSSNIGTTDNNKGALEVTSANIQEGITSKVSFANLNSADEQFNEVQKDIINYFDNDYLWFFSEEAQKYPQVFQGAKVTTLAAVVKVLKSTNDEFEVLAVDCDYRGWLSSESPNIEDIDVNSLRIIKGNQINERFVNGDKFVFYGRYEDVESRNIDGTSYILPTLKATNIVKYTDVIQKYSYNTIKNVAEHIFGKDIKISKDNGEDSYYKVVLDNQSNVNFKVFNMASDKGEIRYNEEENNLSSNIQKHLFVSADFQHYIVTTYDQNTNHVYIDYFDRELKKVWSREFDYNSTKAFASPMDYTDKTMAVVVDNDLYLMDLETGANIIEPIMVGEKIKVNMMSDGIILIGDNNKDTIMKVDYNGKVMFKVNAETKMKQINSAATQVVNGKMVVKLEGDLWSEEYGTNGWGYKYIVLDSDGTVKTRTDDLMNGNFIA